MSSNRMINQLKQVERSWNLDPAPEAIDSSSIFPLQDLYRSKDYTFQTYYSPPSESSQSPIIFIGHHGAGSCGLTFGMLAASIKSQAKNLGYNSTPGLLSFDIRGHSKSSCLNKSQDNYKMSLEQLTLDFAFILNHFIQSKYPLHSNVEVYLIGHSLGGSVLTNLIKNKLELITKPDIIKGLVVIDIVEETAIKSLFAMQSYLNHLPREFNSIDECINWHINTNLLNNKASAELTIPDLLHETSDGKFKWVCDLTMTSKYWNGWFIDLSENFIAIPNKVSKLLILANNDYLDKPLMIGQMQGKYQLVVFHNNLNIQSCTRTTLNDSNNVGHFIHQDIPDKMAICLLEYVERNNVKFFNADNKDQNELLMKLNKKWGVK